MEQVIKRVKTVGKALAGCLTAVAVCLALLMMGARLAGLHPYVVLSGSMEPVYPVGALIYVGDIEPHAIRTGMAITFRLNDQTIVTHRVTRIEQDPDAPSQLLFATKGDANSAEDGAMIRSSQVIGVPIFRLPLLGYLAQFLSSVAGKITVLAAGAVLLAGWLMIHMIKKKQTEKEQEPTLSCR